MSEIDTKIEELKRDGFVFFRGIFSADSVAKAHNELTMLYDRDFYERGRLRIAEETYRSSVGVTVKTEPSHLMIDAYGKSHNLDRIVDAILTHPVSSAVFEKMVGKYFKWRGFNVRSMTGVHDPGPKYPRPTAMPHAWHRDSPGEFGIGIFLTDVEPGGNAGTALLSGSHLYPYCPRQKALFDQVYYTTEKHRGHGVPALARLTIFNRMLGNRLMTKAVEATGKRGDCFFFFNDTWHGRFPNLHGNKCMIALLGGFPTEFPFPDKVDVPPQDVIDRLPASIIRGLTPQPDNIDKSSLIYWMQDNRRSLRTLSLFNLARHERNVANLLSRVNNKFWVKLGMGPKPRVRVPPPLPDPIPELDALYGLNGLNGLNASEKGKTAKVA